MPVKRATKQLGKCFLLSGDEGLFLDQALDVLLALLTQRRWGFFLV